MVVRVGAKGGKKIAVWICRIKKRDRKRNKHGVRWLMIKKERTRGRREKEEGKKSM